MRRRRHRPDVEASLASRLGTIRRELDDLVAERLLFPFDGGRQARYAVLCEVEARLCEELRGHLEAV